MVVFPDRRCADASRLSPIVARPRRFGKAARGSMRVASLAPVRAGEGWGQSRCRAQLPHFPVPMDIGTAVHSRSRPRRSRGKESRYSLVKKRLTSVLGGKTARGRADCPKWGGMSKVCTMLSALSRMCYTDFGPSGEPQDWTLLTHKFETYGRFAGGGPPRREA